MIVPAIYEPGFRIIIVVRASRLHQIFIFIAVVFELSYIFPRSPKIQNILAVLHKKLS